MQHVPSVPRSFLLALTLLSACAAADPPTVKTVARLDRYAPSGVYADFLVGRFALSEADPNQAATEFLRALTLQPQDPELVQQAFIASLVAGRTEALQLARQLPDSQPAQLLLGETAVRAGRWKAAEQVFRAMSHQGPIEVLQPLLLAWAQHGDGRTDAALATLRPLVDGPRYRGIYALHAALIADQAGRAADATRYYRVAETEFGGTNLRLAQVTASWQARRGHLGEAQRTIDGVLATTPAMAIAMPGLVSSSLAPAVPRPVDGIAEAYLAMAATLHEQNAGDYAMLLLRLALDLRPDFTPARLLAAEILQGQGHAENALEVLSPVASNDPLLSVVRLQRASLTDLQDHPEEAIRQLEAISRDYPDSPLPLARIGDIRRMQQRFADALSAYEKAIARIRTPGANDWALYYDRGICYERSRQWDKAQADLEHALKLSPEQPYVLNYLGFSWADMGRNLPEARAMIEKAVAQRPNDGAIVDSLGWVLFRQGQTADAVKTLERAVELDPEDPSINGHLGDAYWSVGRKLEAVYQWRRALNFHPEPDDAAKLEAKLQGEVRQSAAVNGH